MWHFNKINLRRVAFAGGNLPATSAQNSFFQLFNNSQGAEYLVVRDWMVNFSVTGRAFFSIGQSNLAGTSQTVYPAFSGQVPPPGIFTIGSSATTILSGYVVDNVANTPISWVHNYPFCVLSPGWYLTFQLNAADNAGFVSAWWAAALAEELFEDELIQANLALLAQQNQQ